MFLAPITSTGAFLGAQTDALYLILPSTALVLGLLCAASYISTRIIKRLI